MKSLERLISCLVTELSDQVHMTEKQEELARLHLALEFQWLSVGRFAWDHDEVAAIMRHSLAEWAGAYALVPRV
jgi:hypothetical protein